ncbi:imidazole glycerol phosphate synthase subunit HisH [Shewanella algae]|uniref:imidazole glycerol phosphate synthase subunit HisH n=1 Tax=Shewanella algae TaxID=38313 RepID=UPI001AAD6CA0|nr:imidazole glycerol phosphate synthase subunit HisH [Shewanella algae]MBO2569748.1 imidazole glycerol phosphate synthase subunit HisH [Shewanella algae]MBO2582679.1 imidazole glycerol phosphate synthase subunit HisH [Shewanella algae]MCM2529483.1 imidazole glycerol phosphate synthase subunit HisH [Shewanella algae]
MTQAVAKTVIIDTGCANLSSVKYAFERLGAEVCISDDAEVIRSAERVVLPGVGTARAAMAALTEKQLIPVIKALKQPVLGVCLGMQLMCDSSQESGEDADECQCLGLIPGPIRQLDCKGLPSPHMGWDQLSPVLDANGQAHPLFAGIDEGSYCYFVHSFCAAPSAATIAECCYGERFSAAIAKDNFMGVQFHPEKSAVIGSLILANFLTLTQDNFNGAAA